MKRHLDTSQCANKGDAERILAFLKTEGPLSDESAKNILDAMQKGRKSGIASRP